MPRAKSILPTSKTTVDLLLKSREHGEKNDCTVRAIAAVTGLPYEECHEALRLAGRNKGKGCFRNVQKAALEALGFEIFVSLRWNDLKEFFIDRYPNPHRKNCQWVTTHHPERFAASPGWKEAAEFSKEPGRGLLVYVNGHVGGYKDGILHDWTKGSSKKVEQVWFVRKMGETDA
jgi:hypothetical protein